MTLVPLSVLQINVPLLLVNSGDDPLVHNSLLTIPRTLAGTALGFKRNLTDTGSVLFLILSSTKRCLTVTPSIIHEKNNKFDCLLK